MRMVYLILAHDNRAQLDLLIERLLGPGGEDFAVIHADRASPLWPELRASLPEAAGRVHLVADPVAVRWGHSSLVEAIAKLVREAVRLGSEGAHLISGADWPVTPREAIAQTMRKGLCHIEVRPGHMEERMQTFRLDTRWLRLDPARDRRAYAATWELRRLARWADAARNRLGLPRSRPYGLWAYGSGWWSLPADVLAMLDKEMPRLLTSGRLRGTVCSDEHVVPTLVAHAFPERIAAHRRYVDFPAGASSPRMLTAADLPAIASSGAWFARKVDVTHEPDFLTLPDFHPAPMAHPASMRGKLPVSGQA
ncbi:glycosyl transferase family protein [Novosphingobium sp. PY1]|nr:glycosyl transferase family protein [Novosphingobium sp. PY1]